jgi:glycosyltransferase involved in cell wall biosynthesis
MISSKERLSIFLPGLYDGGAERILLNLSAGIAARGHPVDLVLARAEGPYMEEVPAAVRVIDLKARRVLSSLPAFVKYLRSERPAAILSALYANPVAICARLMAGVPVRVIVSEHNTLTSVSRGENDLRWKLYPLMAHWLYPLADGIVAVSQGVAGDLAQVAKLAESKIDVIYNPIVTPELYKKSMAGLDHPWFKPGEPPVVLAVGRLTNQKAFDVLITAFAQVRKSMVCRLLILGEGEERPTLEAMIRQFGLEQDISLAGFVPNPYPYFLHAALFVLSSRWEGLPTVLVEAMALKAAIISTDCPSGPREILDNGKLGTLVAVDDSYALGRSMEDLLKKPAMSWTTECGQPFELEFVTSQYIDLLFGSRQGRAGLEGAGYAGFHPEI